MLFATKIATAVDMGLTKLGDLMDGIPLLKEAMLVRHLLKMTPQGAVATLASLAYHSTLYWQSWPVKKYFIFSQLDEYGTLHPDNLKYAKEQFRKGPRPKHVYNQKPPIGEWEKNTG
uniref:Uncharacterized protein n=1 Tax=Ditylenchus dipsaci TaxID=166011 RepID=A0A915EDP1_9BILA